MWKRRGIPHLSALHAPTLTKCYQSGVSRHNESEVWRADIDQWQRTLRRTKLLFTNFPSFRLQGSRHHAPARWIPTAWLLASATDRRPACSRPTAVDLRRQEKRSKRKGNNRDWTLDQKMTMSRLRRGKIQERRKKKASGNTIGSGYEYIIINTSPQPGRYRPRLSWKSFRGREQLTLFTTSSSSLSRTRTLFRTETKHLSLSPAPSRYG